MADQNWLPAEGAIAPSRSPSPVENSQPAAEHGWWDGPQAAPPRSAWTYDTHPRQSGWNASADGHAAALVLNAAYDSAQQTGMAVPRLDVRWHRPDQDNVRPLGHNERRDLAPSEVHDALDDIRRLRGLSGLERQLLHVWLDFVWLLHSRCPEHCTAALARVDIFTQDELDSLGAAMRAHPLTDFRLLMLCIDSRFQPLYGRTREGPGTSRLYRRFPSYFERVPGLTVVDHATWDADDGGQSGSSSEGEGVPPYIQTVEEHQQQRIRHAERRIRRVIAAADRAQELAEQQETRMREEMRRHEQGAVVLDVLLRGLAATARPAGDNQPRRAPFLSS